MSCRCLSPLISWKKSKVVKSAAVRRTLQNGKKWRLEPFWCVRGTASFLTTLERFYDLRGLRHLQLTFYASNPKKGEGGEHSGSSEKAWAMLHLQLPKMLEKRRQKKQRVKAAAISGWSQRTRRRHLIRLYHSAIGRRLHRTGTSSAGQSLQRHSRRPSTWNEGDRNRER